MKAFMFPFLVILALMASVTTKAADDASNFNLVVAADSPSGTYKKILGELVGVCSDEKLSITEAQGISGGSPGNLDALVNNKAQVAFVQADVFIAMSQADASYKRFQTLVSLYPETIHVIALRESKTKKKGTLTWGTVDFNSLSEIQGYKVGAAGGSVYTLRVLKGTGGGEYDIATFDSSKNAITALDNGELAAVLVVGGAPSPFIQGLDKNKYKLIPVGESIVNRVKGLYRTTTVSYSGLADMPVYTISTQSVLLTRKFNSFPKLEAQRRFRKCFNNRLNDLKDNGSPNWQYVEANDRGVLDWYEIPEK